MNDDRTPDHHTVVAHAVRDYLVTGQEAALDALTASQRIDADRQIATHREEMRRETARAAPAPPARTGTRYVWQLLYIVVGFAIALLCFWGVYTLPKFA